MFNIYLKGKMKCYMEAIKRYREVYEVTFLYMLLAIEVTKKKTMFNIYQTHDLKLLSI